MILYPCKVGDDREGGEGALVRDRLPMGLVRGMVFRH